MESQAGSASGPAPGAARWLPTVADAVERAVLWVVNVLLASLVVIVFIQVVARYILRVATVWSQEAAMFCFFWSVFLAASVGVKRRRHFVFDLLPGDHPLVRAVADIGVFTLAATYAWVGWRVARLNLVVLSQPSEIPLTYFMAAIPVSGMLMIFFLLAEIVRRPWWVSEGGAR